MLKSPQINEFIPETGILLFRFISDEFFKPLAIQYRDVYWECIKILFERAGLTFSLERSLLLEELKEYFEEPLAIETIADTTSGEILGTSPTDKASTVLRKLQEYGWIETEMDKSYVQHINFTEPAIRIYQTIQEIESGRETEYSGRIIKIYSLATIETKDDPDIVLEEMFEETRLLVTELQTLNANIKNYIDDLSKHKTVKELLNVLLNDYVENIINKAYHRLKTSENISKVRPIIIDILDQRRKDKKYINKVKNGFMNRLDINEESASELTTEYLFFISDKFRSLDDIIYDIDKRNSSYVTSAINRSKFMMTDSDDVQGQLRDILSFLNDSINEHSLDLKKIYDINFIDQLIHIYSSLFPDENSMYQIPAENQKFEPVTFSFNEVDLEEIAQKERKLLEKIENQLTQNKIDQYVLSFFGSKDKISLSDLPLNNTEDFIKVIYARLYGGRKRMSYRVVEDNSPETIKINGYWFKDCKLIKNVI